MTFFDPLKPDRPEFDAVETDADKVRTFTPPTPLGMIQIEKRTVEAKTRKLDAVWTLESVQTMKAQHGEGVEQALMDELMNNPSGRRMKDDRRSSIWKRLFG